MNMIFKKKKDQEIMALSKCIILFASLSAPQIVKAAHGSYSSEDVRMLRNGAANHAAKLCQTRRRRLLGDGDNCFRQGEVVEAQIELADHKNLRWFLATVGGHNDDVYDLAYKTRGVVHQIERHSRLLIRPVFRKDEMVDVFTESVWRQATVKKINRPINLNSRMTGRSYTVRFRNGTTASDLMPENLRQVFEKGDRVESRTPGCKTWHSAKIRTVNRKCYVGGEPTSFQVTTSAGVENPEYLQPAFLRKVFQAGDRVKVYKSDMFGIEESLDEISYVIHHTSSGLVKSYHLGYYTKSKKAQQLLKVGVI